MLRILLMASVAFFASPVRASAGAFNEPAGHGQLVTTLTRSSASQVIAPDGVSRLPTAYVARMRDWQLFLGLTNQLMALIKAERITATGVAETSYDGAGPMSFGLQWQLGRWDRSVFAVQGLVHVPARSMSRAPWLFGQTSRETEWRLLVGHTYVFGGVQGFLDLQTGYRFRSAGLGREWHLDVTHGLELTPTLKLLTQSFTTRASALPDNPFALFEQRKRQISLLKEFAVFSLQGGIFRTLSGRHAYVERGGFLAIWIRL